MTPRHLPPRPTAIRAATRCGLAGGLLIGGLMGTAHAAVDCAGLINVRSDSATMTAAAPVSAGTAVNNVTVPVAFCRVQGTARPSADSEIKFEVWLPTTNAPVPPRLKVNGTGGYAGSIPYGSLSRDVEIGFVAAGSNMGHDGGEAAAWTMNHPEKVKDWGLRAHFYVATAAKALAAAFYDRAVSKSYFEGCSNGGRQALMMAQNYPGLFDGIVAGAPSNFYPDLLMWLLWSGLKQSPVRGQPVISTAKRQLITQRVVAACDAIDGAVDGLIANPRMCSFDIDSLGPNGDGSLTAQELAVAKAMYGGTRNEATGEIRYSGAKLGSEADWDPNFADNGGYGNFIYHAVYSYDSPTMDWRRDINFSTVYDYTKQVLTPVTAAPSPDLTEFKARGGKIIQLHGWNDSVVPPDGSINYARSLALFERLETLPSFLYDGLVETLVPGRVTETTRTFGQSVQKYHRLFLMPGVSHCGGGVGASAVGGGYPEPPAAYRSTERHAIAALFNWVENGVAPDKLVATRFNGNAIVRERLLCPWPAEALYLGGDVNRASSYVCHTSPQTPATVTETDLVQIRNALRQKGVKLPNR